MILDECKDTLCNIFVPDNCATLQLTFLVMISIPNPNPNPNGR